MVEPGAEAPAQMRFVVQAERKPGRDVFMSHRVDPAPTAPGAETSRRRDVRMISRKLSTLNPARKAIMEILIQV